MSQVILLSEVSNSKLSFDLVAIPPPGSLLIINS